MEPLGVLVEPDVEPEAAVATDGALMAAAAATGQAILRVRTHPEGLALGRYHRRPRATDVAVHRRLTGGRVAPVGPGFVGVGLVLPHRAALVAPEPGALRPEQVMNRCVRGVLEGLRQAGIDAYYPGRDTITARGRLLGLLAFEVDAAGALLFETIIAVGSDLSVLPGLLDRADPDGVVPAAMLQTDETTSVAQLLGRAPTVGEVAEWLAGGYAARFGMPVTAGVAPSAAPREALDERAQALPHRARVATMLGSLEADVGLAADGTIDAVQLSGDLIADSPGIARLEQALRGVALDRALLEAAVESVYAGGAHFVLGIGPLATIADVILRAVRR